MRGRCCSQVSDVKRIQVLMRDLVERRVRMANLSCRNKINALFNFDPVIERANFQLPLTLLWATMGAPEERCNTRLTEADVEAETVGTEEREATFDAIEA